jgi:hypothetical protein
MVGNGSEDDSWKQPFRVPGEGDAGKMLITAKSVFSLFLF